MSVSTLLSMKLLKVRERGREGEGEGEREGGRERSFTVTDFRPMLSFNSLRAVIYQGFNSLSTAVYIGQVMSCLLDDGDKRLQVELDSELPIKWKLCCGGIAGAVGQSGEHHMTSPACHMINSTPSQ